MKNFEIFCEFCSFEFHVLWGGSNKCLELNDYHLVL